MADVYKNRPKSLSSYDNLVRLSLRNIALTLPTLANEDGDAVYQMQQSIDLIALASYIRRGDYSGDSAQILHVPELMDRTVDTLAHHDKMTLALTCMSLRDYFQEKGVNHVYVEAVSRRAVSPIAGDGQ